MRAVGLAAALAGSLSTAAPALGASLTIAVPDTATVGTAAAIGIEGSTERAGQVYTFVEQGSGECENTVGAQRTHPGGTELPAAFPPPGAFSTTLTYTPPVVASYRVCSYLLFVEDDEATALPRVMAAGLFTPGEPVLVEPPGSELPDPPSLSGPSRQRLGNGKVFLYATCPQACSLTSNARSGRARFRGRKVSLPARTRRKLTIRIPKATAKAMRRQLSLGRKVSVKVVVTALYPGGDAISARKTIGLAL